MAYDWNIDFSTVADEDLLSKEVFDLFTFARWERVALANATNTPFFDWAGLVIPDHYDLNGLATLRRSPISSNYLSRFWLDPDANPEGAAFLPAVIEQGEAAMFIATGQTTGPSTVEYFYTANDRLAGYRPFPPAGTTRKVPREIYSLSQGGSDGEVARLVACAGRQWRSGLSSDPLFGTIVSTPEDELRNSGGKYRREAGAWAAIPRQEQPDVLEEIIPGRERFPFSHYIGDYFGGHWLNDTREILNRLTVICHRIARLRQDYGGGSYESGVSGPAVVRSGGADAIQVDIGDTNRRNWMIEFWMNPLSTDPPIYDPPPYNWYIPYTQWTKLGEMLVSSAGRYEHPLPGGTTVAAMPNDPMELMDPLCAVVIRGDVEGGLAYRSG